MPLQVSFYLMFLSIIFPLKIFGKSNNVSWLFLIVEPSGLQTCSCFLTLNCVSAVSEVMERFYVCANTVATSLLVTVEPSYCSDRDPGTEFLTVLNLNVNSPVWRAVPCWTAPVYVFSLCSLVLGWLLSLFPCY